MQHGISLLSDGSTKTSPSVTSGTWHPNIDGDTLVNIASISTVRNSTFVKNGRVIFATALLSVSPVAGGGTTTSFRITSLPFPIAQNTGQLILGLFGVRFGTTTITTGTTARTNSPTDSFGIEFDATSTFENFVTVYFSYVVSDTP